MSKLTMLIVAFVTMVLTVTCMSQSKKTMGTRVPAQSENSQVFTEKQVLQGFQNTCNKCHTNRFNENSSAILKNNFEIYNRLKWLETAQVPVTPDKCGGCMPMALSTDDFTKNRDLLAAMVDYTRPVDTTLPQYSELVPLLQKKVPPGFKISMLAQVPGARSMTVAPDGTVYVGTGGFSNPKDIVYRIRMSGFEQNNPTIKVEKFIEGLNNPNGVAFRDGSLYVAERNRILVFENVNNQNSMTVSQSRLIMTLPENARHHWKYIRFAPTPDDQWLYVTVGSPCNICVAPDPMQGAIHRVNVETRKVQTIAKGIRNSVGMDFQPQTNKLWFTENGRDELGDEKPNEELNMVSKAGENFGFPFCHSIKRQNRIQLFKETKEEAVVKAFPRPDFCDKTTKPKVLLNAHAAALGMRFYQGSSFPAPFQKSIFIAEHGSWNRTRKSGYDVVSVDPSNGEVRTFVSGWVDEIKDTSWGRPVDVQDLADGSLLISDDGIPNSQYEGAIYRVEFVGKK